MQLNNATLELKNGILLPYTLVPKLDLPARRDVVKAHYASLDFLDQSGFKAKYNFILRMAHVASVGDWDSKNPKLHGASIEYVCEDKPIIYMSDKTVFNMYWENSHFFGSEVREGCGTNLLGKHRPPKTHDDLVDFLMPPRTERRIPKGEHTRTDAEMQTERARISEGLKSGTIRYFHPLKGATNLDEKFQTVLQSTLRLDISSDSQKQSLMYTISPDVSINGDAFVMALNHPYSLLRERLGIDVFCRAFDGKKFGKDYDCEIFECAADKIQEILRKSSLDKLYDLVQDWNHLSITELESYDRLRDDLSKNVKLD
jgi:hypothetical protein